jgi:hypothetical protein
MGVAVAHSEPPENHHESPQIVECEGAAPHVPSSREGIEDPPGRVSRSRKDARNTPSLGV